MKPLVSIWDGSEFLTDSEGNTVANPRHLRKAEKLLKKLHRRLSRKQKQSRNRKKARKALAKGYLKVQMCVFSEGVGDCCSVPCEEQLDSWVVAVCAGSSDRRSVPQVALICPGREIASGCGVQIDGPTTHIRKRWRRSHVRPPSLSAIEERDWSSRHFRHCFRNQFHNAEITALPAEILIILVYRGCLA